MNELFLDLHKHHVWANEQLLDVCESLSDEVLDADAQGTYGTVRDTLVHLVASEASYVKRIARRGEPEHPLKEGTFPGFAELKRRAHASGQELIALAASMTANETVSVDLFGQMIDTPFSVFFAQAINHGTEHRSHVCTILTQKSIEPPNLDVWEYVWSGVRR